MTNDYWQQWAYTKPIAEALSEHFGVSFGLENTGGGCICLQADFEGGIYVLIGHGDGWEPLLTAEDRASIPHGGGYGVGVYDSETTYGLASASDATAQTGEDVIALVKHAIDLVARSTDDQYVAWHADAMGNVTEEMFNK